MRGTPLQVADFSGGIRRDVSGEGIPLDSCYDACNVEPSARHGLHRREAAVSLVGPLASEQLHLFFSNFYNASYSVGKSDGIMRKDGVNIQGGLTTGGWWDWAEAPAGAGGATRLYAADGVNAFKVINNTVVANVVASAGVLPPIRSRFCVWHGGRFFMAENYRLYASGLGDPTDWSTAVGHGYQVDFDTGSPFVISGLARCGPYLLVFKQNAVYVVYDLDTGANRPLVSLEGAASHSASQTIYRPYVSADNKAYFLNRSGVYVTDGNSVRNISSQLGALWDDVYLGASAGRMAYLDGYLMVYNTDGVDSRSLGCLLYDEKHDSWWRHGFKIGDVSWSNAQSSPEEAFVLLNTAGTDQYIVYWRPHHYDFTATQKQDAGKTGTTIGKLATIWRGGAMTFGQPEMRKRIRSIEVQGVTDDLGGGWPTTFSMLTYNDAVDLSNSDIPPAFTTRTVDLSAKRRQRLPNLGVGRSLAVQFKDDAAWKIDNLVVAYQYRKD